MFEDMICVIITFRSESLSLMAIGFTRWGTRKITPMRED
jgi:hypothetical protein